MRIETDSGEPVAERRDPRAAFSGASGLRRRLWWDHLDALYFGGYAQWNYHTTPFLLAFPGVEAREAEPYDADGKTWRRLDVAFPPELPTHSREQSFYFDEAGLLRRLDYTAEVIGGWAKAAHLCLEHATFDGVSVPTRRRVVPRLPSGRPAPGPTLIWIEVDEARLVSRGP